MFLSRDLPGYSKIQHINKPSPRCGVMSEGLAVQIEKDDKHINRTGYHSEVLDFTIHLFFKRILTMST